MSSTPPGLKLCENWSIAQILNRKRVTSSPQLLLVADLNLYQLVKNHILVNWWGHVTIQAPSMQFDKTLMSYLRFLKQFCIRKPKFHKSTHFHLCTIYCVLSFQSYLCRNQRLIWQYAEWMVWVPLIHWRIGQQRAARQCILIIESVV